jgi:hypothetical protein
MLRQGNRATIWKGLGLLTNMEFGSSEHKLAGDESIASARAS